MLFYRRNLPHWHPEGAVLFLTWRLCGSLPASFNTAKIGCATDSPGKRFKTLTQSWIRAQPARFG